MKSQPDSVKGTPGQGLFGATLGFAIGFAAVALFGPTAKWFQQALDLGPMAVGFLVAMPALSGSLLRIPFSAWVDTTGGRKPFLILLSLSLVGMAGLTATVSLLSPGAMGPWIYPLLIVLALLCGCGIATFSVGASQVSYWFPQKRQGFALAIFAGIGNLAPGLFSVLIPLALGSLGLAGSYAAWLGLLIAGVLLYAAFGKNAWFFQLTARGVPAEQARQIASGLGQTLFPSGTLAHSLRRSASTWRTWALVLIYFTTFGGFIALTAWLPTYWSSFFGVGAVTAGLLTALYSVLTSVVRIIGGVLSDHLREGGENTAILSLLIMMAGALVMVNAQQLELALPGILLLAFGMGICNAAVFKIVPQAVPQAVGGAVGWVGGLGAFGGFAIPPMMAFAVADLGRSGYAIGFVVFVFLALLSLSVAWVLKYTVAPVGPVASQTAELVEAGRTGGA
jgi:NNP family nitrate/nitrite transporter-like MFS transporter